MGLEATDYSLCLQISVVSSENRTARAATLENSADLLAVCVVGNKPVGVAQLLVAEDDDVG